MALIDFAQKVIPLQKIEVQTFTDEEHNLLEVIRKGNLPCW
jgi:hypothetical protein